MKSEWKKMLTLIPILLVMGVAMINSKHSPEASESQLFTYRAMVCAYKNNELIGCNHNILVNTGKDMILDALAHGGFGNVTYIAVANNTVRQAVTDTSLQGEWTTCGLARAMANEFTRNDYGNWTIAYTWTVSCDGVYINATGLYNATGTLFAEATLPLSILYSHDSYRIAWTISVS